MKRKLKKTPIVVLVIIIIAIVSTFGISKIVKEINYRKTYDYKLKELGYSIEEVKAIKTLNNKNIDYILTLEYDKNFDDLINEKYFLEKNFDNYLKHLNDSNHTLTEIVAIVNVGAYNDWYTNTKKTDVTKGILILTNKFYSLDSNYDTSDLKRISNTYSYGENQMLLTEAYNAFLNMFNAAKKENLTLIVNSSYRSYESQEEIYNEYKDLRGEDYANSIAAKPGFSEHQTGLAVDIQTYGSRASTFEDFEEFKWLQENAYKYGFILRYPKDKEYLTGYSYESWHYRYVGMEVAKYIQENNITFDEYYAYFMEE